MCEGGGLGEWGGGIGTAVSEDQRDAVRPRMTSAVAAAASTKADRIEMSCFFNRTSASLLEQNGKTRVKKM